MLNNDSNQINFNINAPGKTLQQTSPAQPTDNSETINSRASRYGFSSHPATAKLADIMPNEGPVFLNLGCGLDVRPGFINIDLFSDNPSVVNMDIRKLEFADNSVDFILASDILEHFSHRETDALLAEWYRVLKPNATIIIRCPSLSLQIKAYSNKQWNADIASYMIFGGQTNPGDYHCVAFDETSIQQHLSKAGFTVVDFREEDVPQDKGFTNLNMVVKAAKKVAVSTTSNAQQLNLTKTTPNTTGRGRSTPADGEADGCRTKAQPLAGRQLNIVWEGSQFVYSSLALVNREHCKNIANAEVADLTIVPFEPDTFDASLSPDFAVLQQNDIRHKPEPDAEVSKLPYVWIRHQWPPQPESPAGAKWIIMQPWEFSKIPDKFVEIFGRADEIWTPSNFSRNSFINSGVESDKIQIIPNGINPHLFKPVGETYKLQTQKKFKFLYVGGTTYRKGFDILFRAYLASFNAEDEVCLVIKDMGNNSFYRGQTLEQQIKQAQTVANAPAIEYINSDLTEAEMAALYRSCDVFVSTYRGEGFSLPTLEAMASGLAVIVTKGGATDDFTTDESAWYVNASPVLAPQSNDNLLLADTYLLEPDLGEVMTTLQHVGKQSTSNFSMGLIGSYVARKNWTWSKATLKILARLDFIYDTNMAANAAKILHEDVDDYIILGQAEYEFTQNNLEKAQQLYIASTENNQLEDKFLTHCFNRLAQISINNSQFLAAYKYIEAAKAISPINPDTTWLNANILAAEKKYVEALELLNPIVNDWHIFKSLSTCCISLEQHLLLQGDLLYMMEDLDAASQIYNYALKINNYSADACFGIAKCFIDCQLWSEAKEMLQWAIEYNPDFQLAHQELNMLQNMNAE